MHMPDNHITDNITSDKLLIIPSSASSVCGAFVS